MSKSQLKQHLVGIEENEKKQNKTLNSIANIGPSNKTLERAAKENIAELAAARHPSERWVVFVWELWGRRRRRSRRENTENVVEKLFEFDRNESILRRRLCGEEKKSEFFIWPLVEVSKINCVAEVH